MNIYHELDININQMICKATPQEEKRFTLNKMTLTLQYKE